MHAIVPNRPAQMRPYAWSSVMVNPDPPRVGAVTRISLPLTNPGPGEVIVERIDVRIATFGMGMAWERLDPIGPFHLPPDPRHIEEAFVDWTPRQGGHRCVRGEIHVAGMDNPLMVGRNLDVLHAGAHESEWRVPFGLGNPEPVRAPIELRLGAEGAERMLRAAIRIEGRMQPIDRPVWLRAGQQVAAELQLFAPVGPALDAIRTVEAFIGGRLIDGIQIALHRPAVVHHPAPRPITDVGMDEHVRELVFVP
ncbi:MAG TPA: hypothetical protein VGN32_14510 [Ktedonobacterales bacterium]|nr:hypothetical protein [Ktedonobacterales bacterium]